MSDKLFFIGLKAFIVNKDGKVLIIKRSNTESHTLKWDLTGGRMEFGESIEEGLSREVMEETSMKLVSISDPPSMYTFLKDINKDHQILRLILRVKAKGEVQLSKEHSEYKWINPDEHINYEFPDKDFHKAFEKYIAI